MEIWLRRFLMIVVPLLLLGLETQHAKGFSAHVYDGLVDQAVWWKWLHISQAFLFAGIAVAVYILTRDIHNIWATISRIFTWIFLVTYLVFDSTAGIAVGSILEHSSGDAKNVVQMLFNDSIVGGTHSVFSILGSASWMVAIFSAILALYHKYQLWPAKKLYPPLILLALSGYFLFVGHYPPYGPLAFGCFALTGLWFEFYQFRIGEDLY